MRKILLTLAAAALAFGARGEGYQVNTLSARQGGMAHTGVALRLGSESMYFNPAGMGWLDGHGEAAASVNFLKPFASCQTGGKKYDTDNKWKTPLLVGAAFSITDRVKAGVSFYTPYGSGINWGSDWPGAVLNQKVDLAAYTVQPTVAWRISDRLSVGAGVTMSWGNVNLYKGLIVPSTLDRLLAASQVPYAFGETMPASVNLTGHTGISWGVNLGAMYDITDRLTVGASFRTKSNLKVSEGDPKVLYADEMAQKILSTAIPALSLVDNTHFKAQMPMPAVLTMGASWRPSAPWLLAFDAQLTFWKAYKELNVEFADANLVEYNQRSIKDYHNSWALRAGAQYSLNSHVDLRAGLILDLTPVNRDFYNPETPGMTKIEPSVGASYTFKGGAALNLSFLYVAGLGEDRAKCEYIDLVAARVPALGVNPIGSFGGNYKVHALTLSVGVSVPF